HYSLELGWRNYPTRWVTWRIQDDQFCARGDSAFDLLSINEKSCFLRFNESGGTTSKSHDFRKTYPIGFWYQDFVAGLQKRDHRIKNPLLSTRCCHYLCWIVGHAKLPRIEIDNRLLQLPSASCRRVFRLPAAHCLLSCELDVFGSIKIRFPSAKIDN